MRAWATSTTTRRQAEKAKEPKKQNIRRPWAETEDDDDDEEKEEDADANEDLDMKDAGDGSGGVTLNHTTRTRIRGDCAESDNAYSSSGPPPNKFTRVGDSWAAAARRGRTALTTAQVPQQSQKARDEIKEEYQKQLAEKDKKIAELEAALTSMQSKLDAILETMKAMQAAQAATQVTPTPTAPTQAQ